MPTLLTPRLWTIVVFLLTVVSMPAAVPVATAQTSSLTERMTPERLWAIDRVGGAMLSPDGTQLAYTVSTPDVSANTMTTAVWTVSTAPGATPSRHADGSGPMWLPSGRLVHVAPDGQRMVAGDGPATITGLPEDAANVEIAPTGDYVSFTRNVRLVPAPTDEYPDLPETTVRIHDDLLVRHWTQWTDGTYSHLFVAPLDPATLTVGEATDAMPGQQIHTPLRPFGGAEQITWHADGRRIAYTARPFDGLQAATSTNADVFLYDVRSGETTNLTDFNPGYDIEPAFSPDGSQIAWSSMARDGYESDRNRIFVMDLATGDRRELTEGFDGNAYHPAWLPDGETMLFTTSTEGTTQLYRVAVADGTRSPVTEGVHNITAVAISGTAAAPVVVVGRQSMIEPTDLHRVDLASGALTRLTAAGIESIEGLDVPTVHRRDVPTTDGQSMLVWEIRPPGFDPDLQYPAILYMQGGPQSALTQFFSYRWNFHALAAQGYVVVAPNRRGMPGHGVAWNEQISQDWGGQAMTDLLTAIDAVSAEPYVDNGRVGAVGASFGGYSAFWLAGHHEGRFKTLVAHAGLFHLESMYGSTEELFFVNWDLGGPFWADPRPDSYDRFSPHLFVDRWTAPMLITHGDLDFRVPLEQSLQAYTALRMQGLDGRLVTFPDEGHWINTPQNSLAWHREFYGWLDQYLQTAYTPPAAPSSTD